MDEEDEEYDNFNNFDEEEPENYDDPYLEEYPDDLAELAVAEEHAGAHNVKAIAPIVKKAVINEQQEKAKVETVFAEADQDEHLGEDFEMFKWVPPQIQKVLINLNSRMH